MKIKEKLISELENELRASKFYKKETIDYIGRTVKEAEDLLEKLETGIFDQILFSTNVRLEMLSKWDLDRKITSNSSKPTLKDFKIYCFIEKLNKKIEELSQNDLPLDDIKSKKDKYLGFLNRLKNGVYDDILSEKDFWFWESIDFDTLLSWDEIRQNKSNLNEINLPNYIVFSVYSTIMSHVERVNHWKELFGRNYETRYTYREQTPTTKEELQEFRLLANKLVEVNYNWREARNVVRYFNGLRIYEDHRFPHNFDDIKRIFEQRMNIIFPEFENVGECSHNVDEIMEKAKRISEWLSPTNFSSLFLNENEDEIDIYIRKMIVSQFDFKILSKNSYNPLNEKNIRDMLENPSNYSEYEIKNLLSNQNFRTRDTLNDLCNIAYGTLYSLFGYYRGSNIQILTETTNLQKKLNCWRDTVYYNDVNSVLLPNGERLYSTPYEDISEQYTKFQEEYDYYCANSASDLEYIEGCTEIVGNVVTSQIFREGNKRTAKCLFNALLISRGIVPPIIDFNKDNAKLWNDFACNISNKYMSVKKEILDASLRTHEYFITPEKHKR